eukprot:126355-Chlamydomonas_euryale.AAC.11
MSRAWDDEIAVSSCREVNAFASPTCSKQTSTPQQQRQQRRFGTTCDSEPRHGSRSLGYWSSAYGRWESNASLSAPNHTLRTSPHARK